MCLYRLVCDIKAYDFQVSVKTFHGSVKTFHGSVKTLDFSYYRAFGFGNICFSWSSRKYMTWRRAYIALQFFGNNGLSSAFYILSKNYFLLLRLFLAVFLT